MWALLALATALALDAAAVTAAIAAADGAGASEDGRGRPRRRDLAAACIAFGVAQAAMAGTGAVGGAGLATVASGWVPWVAGGLLLVVGGRMLLAREEEAAITTPGLVALLALALATSLDALAAGVGVPLLGPSPLVSIPVIGLVTAALCAAAAWVGQRIGTRLGPWSVRLAGAVLSGIGLRFLLGAL